MNACLSHKSSKNGNAEKIAGKIISFRYIMVLYQFIVCDCMTTVTSCIFGSIGFIVDCELSEWSDWSTCPVTCGGGISTRTRYITEEAAYGGYDCSAELEEHTVCGETPCIGGS